VLLGIIFIFALTNLQIIEYSATTIMDSYVGGRRAFIGV
jgi:hypothetical protein